MTIEEVIAREEIRETLAAYNMAGDRGRLDELAAAFTEDGVLETADWTCKGRREIVDRLRAGMEERQKTPGRPKVTFVRHNLTTARIDLTSPTTATGRAYFVVLTDVGLDHAGAYVDRYRKDGGSWRIEHRQVRIDWMAENAIFRLRRWNDVDRTK